MNLAETHDESHENSNLNNNEGNNTDNWYSFSFGNNSRSQDREFAWNNNFSDPRNYPLFSHREKEFKMTPTKLTSGVEFWMWYDEFSTYVSQFVSGSAFNLENPLIIPSSNEKLRLRARACLLEWLADGYEKKIFGVKCPSQCMKIILDYHEPDLGFQLGPIGEIYSLKFNPFKDQLMEWCDKLENLHRELCLKNKSWTDERLREVFIMNMNKSFTTFNLRHNQAGKDLLYHGLKAIALQIENDLREQKAILGSEKLALWTNSGYKFKNKSKKNKWDSESFPEKKNGSDYRIENSKLVSGSGVRSGSVSSARDSSKKARPAHPKQVNENPGIVCNYCHTDGHYKGDCEWRKEAEAARAERKTKVSGKRPSKNRKHKKDKKRSKKSYKKSKKRYHANQVWKLRIPHLLARRVLPRQAARPILKENALQTQLVK